MPARTGKTRWDRSTIWAMLRNPVYRGRAAFGKTKTAEHHGGLMRTTRQPGERPRPPADPHVASRAVVADGDQ